MRNGDMKPEPKRGFPGGFFVFLLLAVLIILTIQNLNSDKTAKVAFSHQVEHLVNLDLIQKEDSRKIALNDNLVTFSGKFKDKQTDDAKSRFRYLDLLHRNQELSGQKNSLEQELAASHQTVKEASDLFLHLSGQPLPKGGYLVIDPIYNTASRDNAVAIKSLSEREITSLADLEKLFPDLSKEVNSLAIASYGKDLLTLIDRFRSPALGIGNEAMKQQLKTLESEVSEVTNSSSAQEQLSVYRNALTQLDELVTDLNKEQQNVRLLQL